MDDLDPTVPLLGWVRPGQWQLLDRLAAAGYGLLAFFALANGASSTAEWLAALAGTVGMAAPVALRRRAPVLSSAVLVVTFALMATFAPGTAVMALPPLVLVLYTVAVQRSVAVGAVVLVAACCDVLAPALPDLRHPGGIVAALPVFAASWALGAAFGMHRRHLRVQLELGDRLRRSHERRSELELVEQRVQIARELHDVVAHGLSVITVQAGFAGLVTHDPDEVSSALNAIESTGRQTLEEMRALLEVLRDGTGSDEAALVPAPQTEDLEAVVDRIREAGVVVTLTRSGAVAALPAMVELNAYRIVQEALTNVVKHAGAASATVHLDYQVGELVISVRDEGPPAPAGPVRPGHGITGMQERARILGGTLVAGPLPGSGYEVLARLPVPVAAPVLAAGSR